MTGVAKSTLFKTGPHRKRTSGQRRALRLVGTFVVHNLLTSRPGRLLESREHGGINLSSVDTRILWAWTTDRIRLD